MSHLAILVHAEHDLPPRSLLGRLVEIWRDWGVRVTVLRGCERWVEADALFAHVDLTVVPPQYVAGFAHYPVVINGQVTDISKRRISRNLVAREDGEGVGAVLVKTDRNYGGLGEYRSARRGGPIRRYGSALRERLPWSWRSYLDEYRIFESPRRVPTAVWLNPDLVVERFLPERRGEDYCLRTWLFFGEKERMALFRSREPIVKSRTIVTREPLTEVPDEVRSWRREFGFDFGKFDFAVVEGRAVLYDANRTPVLGNTTPEESLPWLTQLAEGIWSFLPRKA